MKIVIATFGSLGDLHPVMAVGLELRARGHEIVVATSAVYEEKVAGAGLRFRPLRPDIPREDPSTIAYMLDAKKGPERLLREYLMPSIRNQYGDLIDATRGADVMLASELVYAAPLVAETTSIRWATHALAPLSFFSSYDPPIAPNHPEAALFYRLGPRFVRAMLRGGRLLTNRWMRELYALRRELGLGRGAHPVFEGKFSPRLVLAMFSRVIGRPQPDWPANTVQTGFTFFDASMTAGPSDVDEFLAAGDPPVVFTLGSSAVVDPGAFFHESIEAASRLGRRALLIAGDERPVDDVPRSVHVSAYVPYSTVFPRSAAVVHPGGIGTTAQALRAGVPMVVVPYSFDQPDNAARLRRAGVSETIPRHRYRADRVVATLRRVLDDPPYRANARTLAAVMREEPGARRAADAIERMMS